MSSSPSVATLRPGGLPAQPLAVLARVAGAPPVVGPDVTGVTLDSRSAGPGDLFAALPGARAHGATFAAAAWDQGAVAVLTDPDGQALLPAGLPALVVDRPREVLGALAAEVYAHPSEHLTLVGVTGTNGKTTTAFLVEAGLAAAGHSTVLLGTIESHLAGERLPQDRTTPEAPDLQALLAVARQRGCDAGVMEVSSHALALGRVDGTLYAAGIFTNLSQDHLDFHGDMETYFQAKSALFAPDRVQAAVVCVDDPWGLRLAGALRVPHVTVSAAGEPRADWRAAEVSAGPTGTRLRALGPAGEDLLLRVPLPGAFNVANALAAFAALVAVGVAPAVAAAGIASLPGVPGRLEVIDAGQPFTALVDYAHTPDAVAALLAALRPVTPGRLVVVLGCGGDRDRVKRPGMGRAAVTGADLAVLTSDNPRSEDPLAILAEMTSGLTGSFTVEPDREAAIAAALQGLSTGDTVVVAGKGHEGGQESAGVVRPFDDREVLRAALLREPSWH